MSPLILGLLIFLGAHALRLFADGWRGRQIARCGEKRWKGLFSIASLLGLGLIVWGYDQARMLSGDLWMVPRWTRHLASLLTVPAFILVAAAYVPDNRIKARLGHPMVAGVALWALAHLLANARVADIALFGAFLVWATLDFLAARRRDRAAAVRYPHGRPARDALTVAIGILAWLAFATIGHRWLIGVAPFA